MSVIRRNIILNPVEPSLISMRLATGIETKLVVDYVRQNGAAYPADVGGQLYLISRTTGKTQKYLMPTIDMVNGRARATIPAGDIQDLNGYNLQIIGTVDQEPAVIAKGSVSVYQTEALGITPSDEIDTINLAFEYNSPVTIEVTLWTDSTKDAPYDLTAEATVVTAYIYDRHAGIVIADFATTVLASNKVRLSLSEDQVNALPASCWWTLNASTSAGVITLCEGEVTITGTVIPPLTTATFNYDYQNPDSGDPLDGQIVHGNFTRNVLAVAKIDDDANDNSDVLGIVRGGDEIEIDGTVWTVLEPPVETVTFFKFAITPLDQAGTPGLQPVIFRRPSV